MGLLGLIALRTGRYRRAVELLRRAISVNPNVAGVYNHLGEALRLLKRPQDALACFTKAIALKPNVAAGYNNRAIVLHEMKRYRRALANYNQAIALKPDFARAYVNRGNTLRVLNRPQAALESYEKAIAIVPNFAKALLNRGTALHDLYRFEEAVESCNKAIALKPDYAQAYYNRANALRDLGKIEEATDSYEKAIAFKPDFAQARWNQGNCLLLTGQFEKGLRQYEHRTGRAVLAKHRPYSQPLWTGEEDIAGKTLFIYPELYLGDMIQFCRYAKLAEAQGAKVVLSAQNSLRELLRGLGPTIEIIAEDAEPAHFDYHCPLMSLPLAFKTTLETIYAPVPYLRAEEDRVEKWKEKIGSHGIKIGICWQGSKTAYANRLQRSFPLLQFRNIAKLPNVRLISLQKNDGVDQLAGLPDDMTIETLGEEFDAGPHAFLDSAAVLESLDLLITTDTAITHLAGALARPTWVVLKSVPDWRWLLGRADSPWYPTMRLFRQKQRDDWKSAFDDVERALIAEFGAGG